jgi:hypothetical protein
MLSQFAMTFLQRHRPHIDAGQSGSKTLRNLSGDRRVIRLLGNSLFTMARPDKRGERLSGRHAALNRKAFGSLKISMHFQQIAGFHRPRRNFGPIRPPLPRADEQLRPAPRQGRVSSGLKRDGFNVR